MSEQTNVLIVDDEEGARQSLEYMVHRQFPELHIVGRAGSVDEAKGLIEEETPDLLLLDIEMGDGTAFDLLEQIDTSRIDVIFTTAFDHYAIRAIQFSAIDYLLKPVDPEDLTAAIERFFNRRKKSKDANNHIGYLMHNLHSEKKKIAIPDMDGYIFVDLDDIIHCQSDGSYTRFFLVDNQKILASKSLGDYEQLLGSQQFFRVHRSSLINLSHIKKYIKGEGGYVIMSDGSEVEVSRRKKQDFIKILSGR